MSLVFNSPQFAIRFLKARGCLIKQRPATDLKNNTQPILTFEKKHYSPVEGDAMRYLSGLGYRLELESDFVDWDVPL